MSGTRSERLRVREPLHAIPPAQNEDEEGEVKSEKPASKKRHASPVARGAQTEKYIKMEVEENGDDVKSSDSESEEELDYEEMRKRNMKDNEAFLTSLGIYKAKEELKKTTKTKTVKPQKRLWKKKELPPPRRKSLRLRHIDPTGIALPPEPEPQVTVQEHPRLPSGPVAMTDALENEADDHKIFKQAFRNVVTQRSPSKPHSADLARFVADMKKMKIDVKAKVCRDRLFSVAVHPTNDKTLAMAGDKWGRLGFWDLSAKDPENSVVTYRPHSRPIGHIMIPSASPNKIYTCSYDSTLRCCDIEKGIFDEVYSVAEEEDDLFRNFDFITPSTMLVAQFRGDVALLDIRTKRGKAEKMYRVCEKYLRTVSVHPTNTHFFCTAGTDMMVSVWDIRKMSSKGNKPLHSLPHGKAVSSAYFSPLTGGHILTCSTDDTLNVYSCSSSCGEVTRTKTIRHNNQTGRWLTPFRAVWHPSREDVFCVGSMKTPRRMEAFGLDGRLLHEFDGEVLSSVCSVVAWHPSRNIIIGGNSSGYIFPFL